MSDKYALAYNTWQEKTEWVQTDKRFDVLLPWGKHRADILKEYIEHIEAKCAALAAKGMELAAEAAVVYGKYNETQMPDRDLVDTQTLQEMHDLCAGVKNADDLLAANNAEPVAWITKNKESGDIEIAEPHEIVKNHKYWTDAFPVYTAPKQENTMDYITKLSPKLVSVGMFEQLSFHDGFSLKCRELGIHASKLGHIELSKKAQDLMLSASLQQHDQLVDNMASLIELMADSYMRNTANTLVIPDGYVLVPNDMTPQMMRAVQIKSELGGYAASELSGAYDMFAEFWDVAVSAAQKNGN